MAHVYTEEQNLVDIANAIREKNGTDNTYAPSEMAGAIRDLKVGELDFEGVFDQEQAYELNQYYKDGIEYAKEIKEEIDVNAVESFALKFQTDPKIVFFPQVDLSKKTIFSQTFSFSSVIYVDVSSISNNSNVTGMFTYSGIRETFGWLDCTNMTSLRTLFLASTIHRTKIKNVQNITDFTSTFSNCYILQECYISGWKMASISLSLSKILSPQSIHYIIQNAVDVADGAEEGRTLTLHATAKTNWENSEYYAEDLAVLKQKGITIA